MSRKLTMTLGVRYRYHPPSAAKRGAITNVVEANQLGGTLG